MPDRLHLLVEGQTEEEVVRLVLRPHLAARGWLVTSSIVRTRQSADARRGGVTSWAKIDRDIRMLLGSPSLRVLTTLFDYYGFPADAPGMADRPASSAVDRVRHVERTLADQIGDHHRRPGGRTATPALPALRGVAGPAQLTWRNGRGADGRQSGGRRPLPLGSTLTDLTALRAEHERLCTQGLKLDLTRGKPAPDQLELSTELLGLPGSDGFRAADGTDTRNYGGLQGLAELREIWGEVLGIPAAQLITGGNSSLAVMHDAVVAALLTGTTDGPAWAGQRIKFLCPVPGYDRHFAICEQFGIEMIPVPMHDNGPDLAEVKRLVAEDAQIKGMWCVPKYSNPSGVTYSDEVVAELASMPAAAADFRLFWDNAYAVHHLTDTEVEIADVLALAAEAGHPDRPFVFASTSKITLAGSGVSFFGGSEANVKWLLAHLSKRTIGPDKINELRHARFLPDAKSVTEHMRRHRELIGPKFDLVLSILDAELGQADGVSWTKPEGGYFISLDVPDGCARRVVELAGQAGVKLTPAGATFPLGKDPRDRNIRLAPTFPKIEEVEAATRGLAVCVRLAVAEK